MLASCEKQEAMLSSEELAKQDSAAFHVAVTPVMDCLPIYYADRMGIFDSLGLDVRLLSYLSQMDLDTALRRNHAQLGYTSISRQLLMEREGDSLSIVAEVPSKLFLVTAKSKRIRNLKQLSERMVALDRFSPADYWSDQLMQTAGLDQAAIYRPQINDIQLRVSMLIDQLVDAAILPEPYATLAIQKGNRKLSETNDSATNLNCLVVPAKIERDADRKEQKNKFLKAYDKAVDELNKGANADTLRSILKVEYALQDETIDSLSLPRLSHLGQPSENGVNIMNAWIKERKRIK